MFFYSPKPLLFKQSDINIVGTGVLDRLMSNA